MLLWPTITRECEPDDVPMSMSSDRGNHGLYVQEGKGSQKDRAESKETFPFTVEVSLTQKGRRVAEHLEKIEAILAE